MGVRNGNVVLGAEQDCLQGTWQSGEHSQGARGAVGRGLRGVRAQGRVLRRKVGADVDAMGDVRPGSPSARELLGIEVGWSQVQCGRDPDRAGDRLARESRLEEHRWSLAQRHGRAYGAMQLDVVGMPVPAGGVIADEHIGLLLVANRSDPACGGEAALGCEAVGNASVEPRIGVAQAHGAMDAQSRGGGRQLGGPGGGEGIAILRRREPGGPIGGQHQHHPIALVNGASHGAGGQERLVVRVRVHEHQRAGAHGPHSGVRSTLVRIAHVSDCYAPRTGGIETQVRALAGRQAAGGDHVRIITATPGHESVFAGDDVVDGLPVHRVAAHLPFELPIHPRTAREVGRILDAHPVDVVHVHAGVVSPFAWGAVRAAAHRRLPILVTVHSVWGGLARPGFAASNALVRWSSWGVTLSAVSGVAADRVASALPRSGEVLVVPNGIDPDQWRVTPRGGDPGKLRIVTVMRMAPRKRTLPLVRIIESAAGQLTPGIAVSATVVGDGPERARAESYVRKHGLSEVVRFSGRLDRTGILEVFADSDVYLQPSIKESFGLAALEARSAGLPIVARSQTGTTQFVEDGRHGLLAADDVGLSGCLVRLGRDRSLLDRIAEHNRTTPPQDAWPHVLSVVADAYARAGARER